MSVGAKVRALYDHLPFATEDTRIHYRQGDEGVVTAIRDSGGIVIQFPTGIPIRQTSSGSIRAIAFDSRDFTVV